MKQTPGRPPKQRNGTKWTAGVLLATLLLASCHQPRETRSVHMPLAVGNRWVYDVRNGDSVVVEVIEKEAAGYRLSVTGDSAVLRRVDSPGEHYLLRCLDSVLWVRKHAQGEWRSVLSDDPAQPRTETALFFKYERPQDVQSGVTSVVGGDTYRDCIRIDYEIDETFHYWWMEYPVIIRADGHETFAPEVGLVEFVQREEGRSSDVWVLRRHSLVEP